MSISGTKRQEIKMGAKVSVVQKQDQGSGKLTEGVVLKILTNSPNHPHGIKVMLEGGIVGRVKEIGNQCPIMGDINSERVKLK